MPITYGKIDKILIVKRGPNLSARYCSAAAAVCIFAGILVNKFNLPSAFFIYFEGSVSAKCPLSMAGMTHLDHICPLQDNDKSYDGLFSRFLICCPKPIFLRCGARQAIDRTKHQLWQFFAVVKKLHEEPKSYVLSEESMEVIGAKLDDLTADAENHLKDQYRASK